MINKGAKTKNTKSRERVGKREIAHEWVKDRLKKIGKKQKDLAAVLDLPPSRLSEKIKGKIEFQTKEIPVLARELKMPVNVVFARITSLNGQAVSEDTVLLEVRGEAKAGLWRKEAEWPPEVWEYMMVTKEPEHSVVYGLRITGDDMEEFYPPRRSTVMCVPYVHYAKKIGAGDHVVVERADGNGQYEVTVKEIAIKDGRVWLTPHSSNPAYKPIELLRTDGAAEYYGTSDLKITGVVLKAVIDHVPPQAEENRPLLPVAL